MVCPSRSATCLTVSVFRLPFSSSTPLISRVAKVWRRLCKPLWEIPAKSSSVYHRERNVDGLVKSPTWFEISGLSAPKYRSVRNIKIISIAVLLRGIVRFEAAVFIPPTINSVPHAAPSLSRLPTSFTARVTLSSLLSKSMSLLMIVNYLSMN